MAKAYPWSAVTLEVNFGVIPVWTKSFVINDADVSAAAVVRAFQSNLAGTGRQADENEMDSYIVTCNVVAAGQFKANVISLTGPLAGNYKMIYTIQK